MFQGLSAFPLTPMNEDGIRVGDFIKLIDRLVLAEVDSIGVLGSTGSYVFLSREERAKVTELAIEHSNGIPVMVGIGTFRTRDVIRLANDAQNAGASALMLAPVSYQSLTEREVFELYSDVSSSVSIPLCVYDNPRTTHFIFSDELHAKIAHLPNVTSIKIPPINGDEQEAKARVSVLRQLIPAHVSIGISGDWVGAMGLNAGCDVWYSAIGGLFPETMLKITRASQAGEAQRANQLSESLEPLWEMFRKFGSFRVIATAAELLGLTHQPCLPLPIKSLQDSDRVLIQEVIEKLELN